MRASLKVGVNGAEGEVVMVLEEGAGGESRLGLFASCVLKRDIEPKGVLSIQLYNK